MENHESLEQRQFPLFTIRVGLCVDSIDLFGGVERRWWRVPPKGCYTYGEGVRGLKEYLGAL